MGEMQYDFLKRLDRLDEAVMQNREEIVALKQQVQSHVLACPYREDIARARNNLARIGTIEEEVDRLKEMNARYTVMNGIITSIITAAMTTGLMILIQRLVG